MDPLKAGLVSLESVSFSRISQSDFSPGVWMFFCSQATNAPPNRARRHPAAVYAGMVWILLNIKQLSGKPPPLPIAKIEGGEH